MSFEYLNTSSQFEKDLGLDSLIGLASSWNLNSDWTSESMIKSLNTDSCWNDTQSISSSASSLLSNPWTQELLSEPMSYISSPHVHRQLGRSHSAGVHPSNLSAPPQLSSIGVWEPSTEQPEKSHRGLSRTASDPVKIAGKSPSAPLSGESQQGSSESLSGPCRYKTEMCRAFQENGKCKYGDKCQFAHGISEMRNVVRHPKYKTDKCKTYHSVGFCPYGPRCHFIHDEEEITVGSKRHQKNMADCIDNKQVEKLIQNKIQPRECVPDMNKQFSYFDTPTTENALNILDGITYNSLTSNSSIHSNNSTASSTSSYSPATSPSHSMLSGEEFTGISSLPQNSSAIGKLSDKDILDWSQLLGQTYSSNATGLGLNNSNNMQYMPNQSANTSSSSASSSSFSPLLISTLSSLLGEASEGLSVDDIVVLAEVIKAVNSNKAKRYSKTQESLISGLSYVPYNTGLYL